tara:strand:+ start:419 stop:1537 length:1119 start_codon:yes stop_codon:yes gene_type:complete
MRSKFDINKEIKSLDNIIKESRELIKEFPNDPMIQLSLKQAEHKIEKLYIEISEIEEELRENEYLKTLRKHSFYLKFSPINRTHGTAVSLNSIINELLPKIQNSYKNFLKKDFENKFSGYFNYDRSKINKAFGQSFLDTNLLVSDLNFGSFEIGLCSDPIMSGGKTDIIEIRKWSKKTSLNFKENVLDIDFNNKESLNKILETYSEEERLRIFKPVIDIIENPKINFSYKSNNFEKFKIVKKVNRKHLEKIVPLKKNILIEKNENKEYEMIQVFAMVEKGKNPKTIKLENTLFGTINDKYFELTEIDFIDQGYKIPKNAEIQVQISIEVKNNKTIYRALCNGLEYFVQQVNEPNLHNAISQLIREIYPNLKF